ncbi:hypothetical protein H4F18_15855 [Vibrio scophthalmi]|uniref:hypothetical protein n=1 Tax=Vibrio scophthalmi TaxID=45658 RepID=UPI002FF172FF
MSRYKQRGVVTLFVTSILLVIALVMVLASYRHVFYQIKRSHNEVKARQAHWRAEGGIECVYAYLKGSPNLVPDLTAPGHGLLDSICKETLALDDLYLLALTASDYVIESQGPTHELKKSFYWGSMTGLGAIQTTADLRIRGSAAIAADAPKKPNEEGKYECVAIRYKHRVTFESPTGASLSTEDPMPNGPYPGFSGDCASSHKTSTTEGGNTTDDPDLFAQDYLKDDDLDPFYNYFGVTKTTSNITNIKLDYHVITNSSVSNGQTCHQQLADAFASYDKVWVEGHCVLSAPLAVTGPRSLVVANGIFASTGSTSYSGSFFHMVDRTSPAFSDENLASYWSEVSFFSAIESLLSTHTVYFDNGAFHPKGGMHFDSPNGEVVLNGSYDLDYSSANSLYQRPKTLMWNNGGWYAK